MEAAQQEQEQEHPAASAIPRGAKPGRQSVPRARYELSAEQARYLQSFWQWYQSLHDAIKAAARLAGSLTILVWTAAFLAMLACVLPGRPRPWFPAASGAPHAHLFEAFVRRFDAIILGRTLLLAGVATWLLAHQLGMQTCIAVSSDLTFPEVRLSVWTRLLNLAVAHPWLSVASLILASSGLLMVLLRRVRTLPLG